MSGTLTLNISEDILGFDIDGKLNLTLAIFLAFFCWPVNCASPVHKLDIAFKTQKHEHCFFWIVYWHI